MINNFNYPMDSLACFHTDRLLSTFCIFDDLAMVLFPKQTVGRPSRLSLSEIATISLLKAHYGIMTLKNMYQLLHDKYTSEFHLPSYKNFVCAMNQYAPYLLVMVNILLQLQKKHAGTIKIIDSTSLPVCKNIRITSHRVMRSIATRSKTTMGWFYGLKLHLLIDLKRNILTLKFTTASVNDRTVLDRFLDELYNSLILADAGYLSPRLEKKATKHNNILLTGGRKNMKKMSTPLHIYLLNLRIRIESLFSVLKERYFLVTSLPRSVTGYFSHYMRTIFSYLFVPLLIS